MHAMTSGKFRTPKGNEVCLFYRVGTIDRIVIEQTVAHDQYGLAGLSLRGWAFDLGAYIGSVAVCLAADNPRLRVLAVEPVPENAEFIMRNVEANDLSGRIRVIEGAVRAPGGKPTVRFNYGPESPDGLMATSGRGGESGFMARCYSFKQLCGQAEDGIPSFVKMDIEWDEYGVLADAAFREVPLIHGEWHPVREGARQALQSLLGASHDLGFVGDDGWYGIFEARRRAAGTDAKAAASEAKATRVEEKALWPRCAADTLEVAARWIEHGSAARVRANPITREYALESIREIQRELSALGRGPRRDAPKRNGNP